MCVGVLVRKYSVSSLCKMLHDAILETKKFWESKDIWILRKGENFPGIYWMSRCRRICDGLEPAN